MVYCKLMYCIYKSECVCVCLQDLEEKVKALNTELAQLRSRETQESNSDMITKLQALQTQYVVFKLLIDHLDLYSS